MATKTNYNHMKRFFNLTILSAFLFIAMACNQKGKVIIVSEQTTPREQFAVEKLSQALTSEGYQVEESGEISDRTENRQVVVGTRSGKLFSDADVDNLSEEGFTIKSSGNVISVIGADASGELYGCLELADRIKTLGKLPEEIDFSDTPQMVLRGT